MLIELLEGEEEGTLRRTYGENPQNIADLAHQASCYFSDWEGTALGVVIEAVDFKNMQLLLKSKIRQPLGLATCLSTSTE